MKKVIFALSLVVFGFAANAQNNEVEIFQSMFKMEKKALLMDYLQLNEEEATPFWEIYDEYELKRTNIGKKRIALINKYAEEFNTLTDEQADELAAESFSIKAAQLKLHKTYYKKIKKALGAKRAAQFVQFERFINTAIDNELNSAIPLIGEKL